MDAFKVKRNGKLLDYRLGKELDLKNVARFFEKKYKIISLIQENRHVVGIIELKSKKYFLKLATTDGISAVTENEYKWNQKFNEAIQDTNFRTPKNFDSGSFNDLFYFISEYFEGELLIPRPEINIHAQTLNDNLDKIIQFCDVISQLNISNLNTEFSEGKTHIEKFVNKTKLWFDAIPQDIREQHEIYRLLEIVENGVASLDKNPRHGDFTPWHIFLLPNNGLGLIDGEHASSEGIENYDICYMIQRVFSVIKDIDTAKIIFEKLIKNGSDKNKLKTVLASRAIGGYLDESLATNNFTYSDKFRDWILMLQTKVF